MSTDAFAARTMKRKNVKGLALAAPAPKPSMLSASDAQVPGGGGRNDDKRGDTLEIGVEFRLDLRSEDLQVIKELGAGNGGTVSKVMHTATKVVMARKVRRLRSASKERLTKRNGRLYTSRQRRRYESESCESCKSCTSAIHPTLCRFTAPF